MLTSKSTKTISLYFSYDHIVLKNHVKYFNMILDKSFHYALNENLNDFKNSNSISDLIIHLKQHPMLNQEKLTAFFNDDSLSEEIRENLSSGSYDRAIRKANSVISKWRKDIVSNLKKENKSIKKNNKKGKEELTNDVEFTLGSISENSILFHPYNIKADSFIVKAENYSIVGDILRIKLMRGVGEDTFLKIPFEVIPKFREALDTSILGDAIIKQVGENDYRMMIPVSENVEMLPTNGITMGIDLGMLCPAVCYIHDFAHPEAMTDKYKFFGNGRKNRYVRRHYSEVKYNIQTSKHANRKWKKFSHKEQKYMNLQDHIISKMIVEYAISNNVTCIKMEKLSGIKNSKKKCFPAPKGSHRGWWRYNLNNWSFYRLQQYIEYKAIAAGISVYYVNPRYTSQKCPVCGTINNPQKPQSKHIKRHYECSECGYKGHHDKVGAYNITYTKCNGNIGYECFIDDMMQYGDESVRFDKIYSKYGEYVVSRFTSKFTVDEEKEKETLMRIMGTRGFIVCESYDENGEPYLYCKCKLNSEVPNENSK